MKKFILNIALSVGLLSGAIAQSDTDFIKYYDNGNLKEEATEIAPDQFKIVTYFEDGKMKAERYVSNGAQDGTWLAYDNSGNIVAIRNYRNGEKVGRWMIKPANTDHKFVTEYTEEGMLVRSETIDAYGNVVASR